MLLLFVLRNVASCLWTYMVKPSKRKAVSRNLVAQSRHANPLRSLREASSSLVKSSYALRCTLDPRTYIPLQALQLVGVLYAIFVLPGRPESFYAPLSLLQRLIDNAPLALSWSCAGLAVVQTYVGIQLARYEIQSWQAKNLEGTAPSDESGDVATSSTTSTPYEAILQVGRSKDLLRLRTSLTPLLQKLADAGVGILTWSAVLFALIVLLGAPVTR